MELILQTQVSHYFSWLPHFTFQCQGFDHRLQVIGINLVLISFVHHFFIAYLQIPVFDKYHLCKTETSLITSID